MYSTYKILQKAVYIEKNLVVVKVYSRRNMLYEQFSNLDIDRVRYITSADNKYK